MTNPHEMALKHDAPSPLSTSPITPVQILRNASSRQQQDELADLASPSPSHDPTRGGTASQNHELHPALRVKLYGGRPVWPWVTAQGPSYGMPPWLHDRSDYPSTDGKAMTQQDGRRDSDETCALHLVPMEDSMSEPTWRATIEDRHEQNGNDVRNAVQARISQSSANELPQDEALHEDANGKGIKKSLRNRLHFFKHKENRVQGYTPVSSFSGPAGLPPKAQAVLGTNSTVNPQTPIRGGSKKVSLFSRREEDHAGGSIRSKIPRLTRTSPTKIGLGNGRRIAGEESSFVVVNRGQTPLRSRSLQTRSQLSPPPPPAKNTPPDEKKTRHVEALQKTEAAKPVGLPQGLMSDLAAASEEDADMLDRWADPARLMSANNPWTDAPPPPDFIDDSLFRDLKSRVIGGLGLDEFCLNNDSLRHSWSAASPRMTGDYSPSVYSDDGQFEQHWPARASDISGLRKTLRRGRGGRLLKRHTMDIVDLPTLVEEHAREEEENASAVEEKARQGTITIGWTPAKPVHLAKTKTRGVKSFVANAVGSARVSAGQPAYLPATTYTPSRSSSERRRLSLVERRASSANVVVDSDIWRPDSTDKTKQMGTSAEHLNLLADVVTEMLTLTGPDSKRDSARSPKTHAILDAVLALLQNRNDECGLIRNDISLDRTRKAGSPPQTDIPMIDDVFSHSAVEHVEEHDLDDAQIDPLRIIKQRLTSGSSAPRDLHQTAARAIQSRLLSEARRHEQHYQQQRDFSAASVDGGTRIEDGHNPRRNVHAVDEMDVDGDESDGSEGKMRDLEDAHHRLQVLYDDLARQVNDLQSQMRATPSPRFSDEDDAIDARGWQ